MIFINARANLGLGVHTVAEPHRLRALCYPFDEFVGDFIDDNRATRGGTTLARRSESSLRRVLNGEIHVAVFENDDWILAAHFALALCAAPRNLFVKSNADRVRSGERNGLHCGMIDDFIAGLRS